MLAFSFASLNQFFFAIFSVYELIQNVKPFESLEEEDEFFQQIYRLHTVEEWLDTNLILEVGTFIAQQLAHLFDDMFVDLPVE